LVVLTVSAGLGMGALGERLAQRDVAIGIVLAFSLALGLLFLHFFTAYATQAAALLFGNVLAVDAETVWTLLALGLISVGALSAGLALMEAWAGIALAYYTDWPSSFWITTLSAAIYLLANLADLGRSR